MDAQISDLIGKSLTSIKQKHNELIFICDSGEKFKMSHLQDCTETVIIDDICGDLQDLIGTPIIKAEEVSNENFVKNFEKENTYYDSFTFTFYKLATIKGYVDIRWFGESNGCYSEAVDFQKANEYGEFKDWYDKYVPEIYE